METESRYIKFEDLPSQHKNIKEICLLLFSSNWEENFESLNDTRSFIKFNWDEFQHYWKYLRPRILNLTTSIRSVLAKNALLFISELLIITRPQLKIPDILQLLISKSAVEKSFLKDEVLNAIKNACDNYPCIENCDVFISQSFSKSAVVSKIALKYLEQMVCKLGYEEKFNVLLRLADGKRQDHILIGKKIITELETAWEDYNSEIDKVLNTGTDCPEIKVDEKVKNWVSLLVNSKKQEKVPIKDLIKKQKENKCDVN
ncbi:hypothetical protein SteCoe_38122 [Stentor coeruleus]|uniref:CLASP N-terminal domain-containing protein n=1 Tax=Stentor coeruleus TaxID=5963 RepID=A0A1R2AM55_9CILI|nr:hypothetical protein SteCoe_38122 [Stentor coeruleus]